MDSFTGQRPACCEGQSTGIGIQCRMNAELTPGPDLTKNTLNRMPKLHNPDQCFNEYCVCVPFEWKINVASKGLNVSR